MMGILQVKLVTVLVLLKLAAASDEIDKAQYYRSLTPQERLEIFNIDDVDHVPNFEIIHIDFPRLQKRSSNEFIPLTLPLANKNVNLNLRLAAPLVGPNTPFYVFRAEGNQLFTDKTFPFKEYILNVYEDEDQQASLVVDIDAYGNKYIHSGIIGSHNISIYRAPGHENLQMKSCYIVRIIDLILNGGRTAIGESVNTVNTPVIVPDVIYPEILVLVDFSIYNQYIGFDSFKNYILNFWTSVNLKYKSLTEPKYKLSIAGIVAAQNRNAFSFISSHSSYTHLDFESALINLQTWLYRVREIIPIESYDVAITHTLLSSPVSIDWLSRQRQTLGLANVRSACQLGYGQVLKSAIVYDDNNYGFVLTAAHELAHTLGAYHDDDTGCRSKKYIMSAVSPTETRLSKLDWSQCSLNGFRDFLSTNPQCLFNVPEPYQKKIQSTTMTPLPTIGFDINNRIDTDFINTKTDNSNGRSSINKNSREGRGFHMIPQSLLNEFIPLTNVKYSDLESKDYYQLPLKDDDLADMVIDLQPVPPNRVIYVQVVKKNLYMYFLEKDPQNRLIRNNGQLTRGNIFVVDHSRRPRTGYWQRF